MEKLFSIIISLSLVITTLPLSFAQNFYLTPPGISELNKSLNNVLINRRVASPADRFSNKADLTEISDRQLLEKTAKKITNKLAKKYLGIVRSDDIYSCAFSSVWEAWKEYDPENEKGLPLEGWLYNKGMWKTQDALRADGYVQRKSRKPSPKKRPLSTLKDGEGNFLPDAECVADTREKGVEQVEMHEQVKKTINQSSPAAQIIVKLLYYYEMTQKEISLLLEKTEAAVSKRHSRIKEKRYSDLDIFTNIYFVTPGYGARIMKARIKCFMTQKDLAALLGVFSGTVRTWEKEKEKAMPTFNHWFFLAHVLHVPVTYLLQGINEPDWDSIQRKYLKVEPGWGRGIQDLQQERGLSTKGIAVRVGVSEEKVNEWKKEACIPTFKILRSLANALNTSLYRIMHGKEVTRNFREVNFSEQVEEVCELLTPFRLKAKLGWKKASFAPIPREVILYPEERIKPRPYRSSRISQKQKLSIRKKLKEQLGIPEEKISQYPGIDALDFEKVIFPRWEKLTERLGIPEDEIRRLPLLLFLDFEGYIFPIWEKLIGTEKGQLGMPKEEIRQHSRLITLDFEGNIFPTYCYLVYMCSIGIEKIKELPMCLTQSLNTKIRPRTMFLLLNGRKVNAAMVSDNKTRFQKRLDVLGLSHAEYEAFLGDYNERERLFNETEANIRKRIIPKSNTYPRKKLKIDMVWLRIFFDEYIIAHGIGLEQVREALQKVRFQIEAVTDHLPSDEKPLIRERLIRVIEKTPARYINMKTLGSDLEIGINRKGQHSTQISN